MGMRVAAFVVLTVLSFLGNALAIDILPFKAVTIVFGSIPALFGLRLLGLWPGTLIGLISGLHLAIYFGEPLDFFAFGLEPLFIGLVEKRLKGSLIRSSALYWSTIGTLLTLLAGPLPPTELVWVWTLKRILNGAFNASASEALWFLLSVKLKPLLTRQKQAMQPSGFPLRDIFFVGGCLSLFLLIGFGSTLQLRGVVKETQTQAHARLKAEAEKLAFLMGLLKDQSPSQAKDLILQAKAKDIAMQIVDSQGLVLLDTFEPDSASIDGTRMSRLSGLVLLDTFEPDSALLHPVSAKAYLPVSINVSGEPFLILVPSRASLASLGKKPSFQWESAYYTLEMSIPSEKGMTLRLFLPNGPLSQRAYHLFLWWMGVGTFFGLIGIPVSSYASKFLSQPIEGFLSLTGRPIEELLTGTDPTPTRSRIKELMALEENFITMIGALREALERLKAQEAQKALKESEERLKTLIDALQDPIILKDHDARRLVANKTAIERFGLYGIEWHGKTDQDLALELPFYERAFLESNFLDTRAIREGIPIVYETEVVHLDRKQHAYTINKTPLKDEQGQVRFLVDVWRDTTREKMAQEEIQRLLNYDPTTGLPNRILLLDRLSQALKVSSFAAVIHLDIDKFKNVVDVFGFDAASNLFKEIASRLIKTLRPTDTLAKLPEDTFILVFSGLKQPEDAILVANKAMQAFKQPFYIGENEVHLTASLGFAIFPTDGKEPETLLKNAELAMFRSKELGGNTIQRFSSELGMRIANFIILENNLRNAIKKNEFTLFYQPQVAVHEQRVMGMEALIRWTPKGGSLVPPAEFIPVAEQSGLIVAIGAWVLKQSLAHLRSIKEAFPENLYVSVNLSPKQFMDFNLVRLVEESLKQADLPPNTLELEITESTAMKNLDFTLQTLQALKSMGVRIALDDFGVDYSSLSYIHRFPIDTIKIDRNFIVEMLNNPSSAAIVRAIIQIAQSLNLKVIAEGVETEEQLGFLRDLGCFGIQGYIFSKPLPLQEFLAFLNQKVAKP